MSTVTRGTVTVALDDDEAAQLESILTRWIRVAEQGDRSEPFARALAAKLTAAGR